jgi:MFS family permease
VIEQSREANAGWVQGLLVSSAGCMVVISGAAVLPIIPSMLHAFRGQPGSDMLVQLAAVSPLLAIALTGPIAGVLGERVGRRALLNVCMLAFALFGVAPFWLADLRLIVASRVLMGVAASGMVTSAVGLTGDYYSGAPRQRWLAIQGAAGALASVVSSAASGALAEMNWRLPFLMMAVGFPVFLALLAFAGPPASAAAGDAEEVATGAPGHLHLPQIAAVFALGVAVSIMFWPPAYGFGLLLEEKGHGSAMLTGLTVSISAAGAFVGSFCPGLLRGASFPLKQAAAFAMAGAGMAVIWVASGVPLLMAGAIAVGVAQGATGPILSGWLLEETPFRLRGRTVGLYNTTFFLAQFGSPLLARIVATSVGSTNSSMAWYAAACVLPILAIAGFRAGRRAPVPSPLG